MDPTRWLGNRLTGSELLRNEYRLGSVEQENPTRLTAAASHLR